MRVQSIGAKRGTVSPSILFNHFFSIFQDSEYAAFHCGCITALSSVAVVHSGVGRLAILFLFYGCFTILFYSFYTQIGLTEAVPPLVAISLLSLLWNPIWVRIFAYDGISDFVTLAIPIVMFLTVTSIQSGKWGLIDVNGNEVVKCRFDDISSVYDGKAWAKQNGKWGIIKLA